MTHEIRYIETRSALNEASASLSVAYWTNSDFHAPIARAALVRALCGADEAALIDKLVREANIKAPQAQAVINALLDHAVPLPTPDDEN